MATAPLFVTPQEYLRIERASEEKHEYIDGQMFAMAGANRKHRQLMNNILGLLLQSTGEGCEADNSETRLYIPQTGRYTYADVVLKCGEELKHQDDNLDTLLNPNLIVEVLSPSTEAYDRGAKFRAYQSIPSFVEYLLVSQDKVLVEHYTRNQNDSWTYRAFSTPAETITFFTSGPALPMEVIYRGVQLDSSV